MDAVRNKNIATEVKWMMTPDAFKSNLGGKNIDLNKCEKNSYFKKKTNPNRKK